MYLSRHQLHEALLALDHAQRVSACPEPRRTDKQERWSHLGEFEVGDNPPAEHIKKNGKKVRTNAPPLPDPHGRAFLTIDPETFMVECAACAAKQGGK